MPAKVEAIVKPELLVWARKTSGLDQDTVANKLKISVERLQGWESGEEKLSIPQLRRLAEVYKRPLSVFFLSEVPTTFKALHDYRRLPDGTASTISSELAFEIRKALNRREVALELMSDLDEEVGEFDFHIEETQNKDNVAFKIRQFLGIEIQEQLRWRSEYEALNAWKNSIEGKGVLVFQTERVPVSEMRGMSIYDRLLPVIVLNGQDAPYARIFSLLHEFTHLVTNHGGICDMTEEVNLPLFNNQTEVFCNHIAGATLVPTVSLRAEPAVRINSATQSWTEVEIKSLADRFKVSEETLVRRLVIIGAAPDAFYRQKREEFTKRYNEIRQELRQRGERGGPPRHRIVLRNNGLRYTKLVLDAYNEDMITARDVADFLDVRLKHLKALDEAIYTH